MSEHHSTHMLRADWEMASPVDAASEDALIGHVIKAMPRAGAVVLSDYAKGALTPRVIRAVIDAANKLGKPVVVDPKGRDYGIYRGATLITPNRQELADATHSAAQTDDQVAAAAAELGRALGRQAVLVTRSEAGMTLVGEGAAVHVPAYPVRVRDVSGAGDTVVAVLSPPCSRCGPISNPPCARPMPPPRWWSANAAPRRCRSPNCARAFCRRPRSRPRRRSCSTGRCSTSISPNGGGRACASASPMAASICCIPATSNCWPARARPATGWWWA